MKTRRFLFLVSYFLVFNPSPAISSISHENMIRLNQTQTALRALRDSIENELNGFGGKYLLGSDNLLEVCKIELAIQEKILPQIELDASSNQISIGLKKLSISLKSIISKGALRNSENARSILIFARSVIILSLSEFRELIFGLISFVPGPDDSVEMKQRKIDEMLRFFNPFLAEVIKKSGRENKLTQEEFKQLEEVKVKVEGLLEVRKGY